LGIPIALQNVLISVGGILVQSIVNGCGTAFIAGFTATNKLYGVLEIAALSYGFAITTYVGQNYGAGEYRRIRTGVSWSVGISVLTSGIIAAAMLLFGRQITMLFISADTPQLAVAAGETAYRYLCVMSLCLTVLYLLYVYRSALQGMGNTLIPMLSGVAEFVMRVGVAFLTAVHFGWQEGVFVAEVSAWTGAAVLLAVAYYAAATKLKRRERC
jgi:Na+-driven multidrug efflux pump